MIDVTCIIEGEGYAVIHIYESLFELLGIHFFIFLFGKSFNGFKTIIADFKNDFKVCLGLKF